MSKDNTIINAHPDDNLPEKKSSGQNVQQTKKHLIKCTWLRRLLKSLLGLFVFTLCIPILIYIPPIQNLLKNLACEIVSNSTGMTISIDKFRLKFPIDLSLEGVYVLDRNNDTMVKAKQAIVDVKFLPMLQLDAQINKFKLLDGYYRMVAEDSSMILSARLKEVEIDNHSHLDLNKSLIDLNKATIRGGHINLNMNVWKSKPKQDSTPSPWIISAKQLDLQDTHFSMAMLPLIDTLDLNMKKSSFHNAIINLSSNKISANNLFIEEGNAIYLTPTPDFIANHPAPIDTTKSAKPPMEISCDSVIINDFNAIYAIVGKSPTEGFDPEYIKVDNLTLIASNFFNRASELSIPISFVKAEERSGLKITEGKLLFNLDSTGISLSELNILTEHSSIIADMFIPSSLMQSSCQYLMSADATASIGITDINNFLPAAKQFTNKLPKQPINLQINALGSLANLNITDFNINSKNCLDVSLSGNIKNISKPSEASGELNIYGKLQNSNIVSQFIDNNSISFPSFYLDGDIRFNKNFYFADIEFNSHDSEILFNGELNTLSEKYIADLTINNLNVYSLLPSWGIGMVDTHISVNGTGFNPMKDNTKAYINAEINKFEYQNQTYSDITLDANIDDGDYLIHFASLNPMSDFNVNAKGYIEENYLDFDIDGNLNYIDLYNLGFTDDINSGNGDFNIKGWIEPKYMLCEISISANNFNWTLPEQYIHIQDGFKANFSSTENDVSLKLNADKLSLNYHCPQNFTTMIEMFEASANEITTELADNQLHIDKIKPFLPHFKADIDIQGSGIVRQFLDGLGIHFNNMSLNIDNSDNLVGNLSLIELNSGSIKLDTIKCNIKDRGRLLDYKIHIGNTHKNLPELNSVNLNGYIGGNRGAISLTQKNIKGETGYRIGMTVALLDSTISVHFTPLNATIGYMPWEINDDNYLGFCFATKKMEANLQASGTNNSQIALRTEFNEENDNQLMVNITNLNIEDFLKLSASSPSISGQINSDIVLVNKNKAIIGNGNLSLNNLRYDRQFIGSLDFDFDADLNKGKTEATIALLLDNNRVLSGHGVIANDSVSDNPVELDLQLKNFPLKVINPFLDKNIAKLSGNLNGNMDMVGSLTKPRINGEMICDSVNVFIPIIGSNLKLDTEPIIITDNIIKFNNFGIWGTNDNPLVIDGDVDAKSLSKIGINLNLSGRNVQLINNDKRARSDIYGKLFVNFDAEIKGNTEYLDAKADLSILPATDIFYTLSSAENALTRESSNTNTVKFVNFSDTTTTATDSVFKLLNMKLEANLNIMNGSRATINLSSTGKNRVQVNPNGNLTYSQSFMGDTRVNGQLNIGSGYVRYTPPLMSEKHFIFDPQSYILWNGNLMNPILNVYATDNIKANVKQEGQDTRYITFDVSIAATNTLSSPKIIFDLSTTEDATVQNEILSMSADQRSNQAMNLLLYNSYTGPSTKTSSNILGNPLYSFLESQLNSWAASNIQGVDLSFGIDQYDKTIDGQNSKTTSYSYQVSKSLFDNKFKIVVGGNYTTDASADENFAQNLISDISFEYTIKQTNNLSMYVKLFRHTGFESILEGEITETGIGFVMKRKINSLKDLFRFGRKKDAEAQIESLPDSIQRTNSSITQPDNMSEVDEDPITEGYDIID